MHLNQTEKFLYAEALSGERVESLPPTLLAHCEECLVCKREVLELAWILKDINSGKPGLDITSLHSPRSGYLYLFKAAAIIICLTLPLYFMVTNISHRTEQKGAEKYLTNQVQKEENVGTLDKNKIAGEEKEFASAERLKKAQIYEPIPYYENISGDVFRSESAKIISPENGLVSAGEVTFRFDFAGAGARYLKVFNNKDVRVFKVLISDNEFELKKTFGKGLFYWKLETEKDLIYLGKFSIK